MELAPIVLFVYNRPKHTLEVLKALRRNEHASKSTLYIFSDGPKDEATETELIQIHKVRAIIKDQKWCNKLIIKESVTNKGLTRSIVEGVAEIVNRHGKIIVLEDDIVPQPQFLTYMNDALNKFEHNQNVMSISSFNFFARSKNIPEFFFFQIHDCWGWGTWKRGWDLFESDAIILLKEIENAEQIERFDLNGAYPYFKMLKDAVNGKVQSWAIKWYASGFVHRRLSFYPKQSMVFNIGFDGSGINSGTRDFLTIMDSEYLFTDLKIGEVENNEQAINDFREYFKKTNKHSLWIMVKFKIIDLLKSLRLRTHNR